MTEALHQLLKNKQDELKNQWAFGNFTDPSKDATLMRNIEAVAICGTCEEILSLNYEILIGELVDDGEQKRPEATGTSSPN